MSHRIVKAKASINSFTDAAVFLSGQDSRMLTNNTVVRMVGDSIAIQLYDTDIITYHNDGTFEFNDGGYPTKTTCSRCNQFGPVGFTFYRKQGELLACKVGDNNVLTECVQIPC